MGIVRHTLYGIRRTAGPALAAACALLWAAGAGRAEDRENPVKQASDYTSVEYFDPPHELQISSRITGAEAIPLPGGHETLVRQFKLELFGTNGLPTYIVEAPNCRYDEMSGTASSPGHLTVRSADGKVTHEGDGFLWRQDDKFLTISNHVHTVIKDGPEIKAKP
jgi:hypothetical protein